MAAPGILSGLNWDPMVSELKSYYGLRVTPALRYDIIQHIVERRKNAPYRSFGDIAADIGHLPEKYHSSKKAPQATQEAFIRYNANLITTKSSIFKTTVLAQAFGEKGRVAASRKLKAIVDRGYSPGSFDRPGEDDPSSLEKPRRKRREDCTFDGSPKIEPRVSVGIQAADSLIYAKGSS